MRRLLNLQPSRLAERMHRPLLACLMACQVSGQSDWTASVSTTESNLNGVAWGGGAFVAVGDRGVVLRSPDGERWEPVASGTQDTLEAVAYGRGVFVATGRGGRVLVSPDGLAWAATRQDAGTLNAVSVANGRFVSGGSQGIILVSDDGLLWSRATTPGGEELRSMTSFAGLMVMVGFSGTAWTSADAENWVPRSVPAFPALRAVEYYRGEFISAAGSGATLLRSTNGIHWVSSPNGTGARLNALTQGLESLVAVGFDQAAFTSTNGVDWVEVHRGAPRPLRAVTYGGGTFVAVGELGAILSSPEVLRATSTVALEAVDAQAFRTGPNPARVRIRREGATDQAATVTLQFGGTAVAGEDYIALPDVVDLPRGSDSVEWSVLPVEGSQPQPRKILAISIAGATAAAVDPVQRTAAVFIQDGQESVTARIAAAAATANHGALFQWLSPAGQEGALESTEDFQFWNPFVRAINPFGQMILTDPTIRDEPVRFYRPIP